MGFVQINPAFRQNIDSNLRRANAHLPLDMRKDMLSLVKAQLAYRQNTVFAEPGGGFGIGQLPCRLRQLPQPREQPALRPAESE